MPESTVTLAELAINVPRMDRITASWVEAGRDGRGATANPAGLAGLAGYAPDAPLLGWECGPTTWLQRHQNANEGWAEARGQGVRLEPRLRLRRLDRDLVAAVRADPDRLSDVAQVGVVIGWLIIWAGAQADPETLYWPVKFVVEDLPSGLR